VRRSHGLTIAASALAVVTLVGLGQPSVAAVRKSASSGQSRAAAPLGELLTYDYDNARNGVDVADPSFSHLVPAWTNTSISGGIYGQPLVDGKLVIVATENDEVYGLNASTGKIAWKVSIGSPATTATIDTAPTLSGGCGDIDPLGITGTPVIDSATSEVFVAGEVQTGNLSNPSWRGIKHMMVALKFTDTSVKKVWVHQIDPPGAGSTYEIPAEQQRSSLTFANGRVYAEFGGLNGDCGSYQGYVLSLTTLGKGLQWFKVPTAREGAIWATDGAATNAKGELFVATGNSNNDSGAFDYGDAVIGLTPSLKIDSFWGPNDWAQRNAEDLDLGSGGPILLPNSNYVFETGKGAVDGISKGFLLDESKLGGVGHSLFTGTVCPNDGFMFGANATEIVKVAGRKYTYIYVPCPDGTVALRVNYGVHPTFFSKWAASGPNGPPIIAGGLVWALATDGDGGGGPSDLYGMSLVTGKIVVRKNVNAVEHFATPGAGDGMMYVAGQDGVQAFKP
jgi:hypothetical protein